MLASAQAISYELHRATPTLVVVSPYTLGASVSSSALDFGSVDVGLSVTRSVLVSNSGTGPLTLSLPSTTGSSYSAVSACAKTLSVGADCQTDVTFAPTAKGALNGTLTLPTNAPGSPFLVNLTGIGLQAVGALYPNGASDFGSIILGQSASLPFTFANSGNKTATGVYATTNDAQLSFASNSCGTLASPVTVAAGSSCSTVVQYRPNSATALSGAQLVVTSTGQGAPNVQAVTGSGVIVAPTLGQMAPLAVNYGDASFAITAPTSPSAGAFTYSSSNPAVATVTNASGTGTVTLTGVGTTTLTATQAANGGYLGSSATTTLTVATGTPALGAFTVPTATFRTAPPALVAPSSPSAGAFTYSSSNTSVATVSGTTLTLIGMGTTNITATQAAAGSFKAASTVTALTVNGTANPLGAFTVPAHVTGDAAFALTAPTSTSGGPITYSSGTPSVATVAGSTVSVLAAGQTLITASQAAYNNYAAATTSATLTVTQKTNVYATWNPSDASSNITLSNGSLTVGSGTNWNSIRATTGKSAGKWYWETTITSVGSQFVGLSDSSFVVQFSYAGGGQKSLGYMVGSSYTYNTWSGATVAQPSLSAEVAGDVIMIALDMDNHTAYFGRNGTWTLGGVPTSGAAATGAWAKGLSGTVYPTATSQNNAKQTANFGASSFKYTVPAGYNAGVFN